MNAYRLTQGDTSYLSEYQEVTGNADFSELQT